jgi:hypothetical protein
MELVLAAIVGALATAVVSPLMLASVEVSRQDRQVAERDEDLEEWIVVRHRHLKRRWQEIARQAATVGVSEGGSIPAGRVAVQTELLYDYREELRRARSFVLRITVEERWTHRLARSLRRRPFPGLTTPLRAERLVDSWSEGTGRNALTWSLEDILQEELPERATSRAVERGEQPA